MKKSRGSRVLSSGRFVQGDLTSPDETSFVDGEPDRGSKGRAAEALAATYLESCGLSIIARNVRVGRLEIDIVALEENVVAIVEVRYRGPGSWVGSFASVDLKKRQRLRRAGESLWRTRFKGNPLIERMRFDVLAVRESDGDEPAFEYKRAAF